MTARLETRALKRLLRLPAVIIGELAGIALAGALGACLPQAGSASAEELARWQDRGPVVAALFKTFALDHVFHSWWFLTVALLTSASLLVIVIEQAKRLRVQWSQRLTPAHFSSAPFHAEFERPATDAKPQVRIWSEQRLGLAGSGVFHLGVLLIMLAGALRALFGTEAVVDLMEGEVLVPTAQAWAAQWPGVLGRPYALNEPLTLRAVNATRYDRGDLHTLSVTLETQRGSNAVPARIAVNQDLRIGGRRVFLGSDFGAAVLIEWQKPGAHPIREAALLQDQGKGSFAGTSSGPDGWRAHLNARGNDAGDHPGSVEVRVMQGSALLFAGHLRVGETRALPGGTTLTLHGTPFWARLRGSHDAALWLAYVGMVLVMLGATLIFTLVKRDCCVVVTPLGERERVFVALKPQRFAPLFQERFEQLVRELGGSGTVSRAPEPWRSGGSAERRHPFKPETAARCRVAATERSLPAARVAGWLLLAGLLVLTSGCGRVSQADARKLVEQYNQVVSEAYRRGDVRLIDPVVGPNEGRKLTGLIGVRLDMGITLDSKLLSLEITGVEPGKNALRVRTKERWSYRDLRIGSGEQVGEASQDSYEMIYCLTNVNKSWLVDEIKFAAPPQVGRQATPWVADRAAMHGITAPPPGNQETNRP